MRNEGQKLQRRRRRRRGRGEQRCRRKVEDPKREGKWRVREGGSSVVEKLLSLFLSLSLSLSFSEKGSGCVFNRVLCIREASQDFTGVDGPAKRGGGDVSSTDSRFVSHDSLR